MHSFVDPLTCDCVDRIRKHIPLSSRTTSKMWYPWVVWVYFTALLSGHSPRVQLRGTSNISAHIIRTFSEGHRHFFLPSINLRFTTHFLSGIPFAEPPVAGRRFAPPQLKLSLAPSRSFDARSYGPSCLQLESSLYSPSYSPSEPNPILQYLDEDMSEDCLTLNIVRPSGVDSLTSLPVMVWIYGGGFYSERCIFDSDVLSTHISPTRQSSIYDGRYFVEQFSGSSMHLFKPRAVNSS